MDRNSDLFEIKGILLAEKAGAILLDHGMEKPSWLPKSQIDNWEDIRLAEEGDRITVSIPEWLALNEGMI